MKLSRFILLKIAIVSYLLVESVVVVASPEHDCYLLITNNYEKDSVHFYRQAKDSDRDYGKDYLGNAFYIIKDVLAQIGCSADSVNFGKGPDGKSKSRCEKIVPEINSSRVCYIESNLGYFYVSWNQMDSANVVFNRWD